MGLCDYKAPYRREQEGQSQTSRRDSGSRRRSDPRRASGFRKLEKDSNSVLEPSDGAQLCQHADLSIFNVPNCKVTNVYCFRPLGLCSFATV